MTDDSRDAKIYKMYKPGHEEFYIGSTTMTLDVRLHNHKQASILHPERLVYKTFGDMKGVTIELIESMTYRCKEEILWRERYWYDKLKPTLNSC
jgi:hypothetical protein